MSPFQSGQSSFRPAALRQPQRLFEEVARLSELDLLPADYFGEFLKRVLSALAAPAGAVWMRTPQGNLQLQYQVNLQGLGLNRNEEATQAHQELLRVAFQQPRPFHLPPQSFAGQAQEGQTAARVEPHGRSTISVSPVSRSTRRIARGRTQTPNSTAVSRSTSRARG